ncbi:MAG: N-6 DNA methylase [Planctomycetota bacterium]
MKGQRAVDFSELQRTLGLLATDDVALDAVLALEGYFFLICSLVATSAFEKQPRPFIEDIRSFSRPTFRLFLRKLISGELLDEHGIFGSAHAFDFMWAVDGCSNDELVELRNGLADLGALWDDRRLIIPGLDPLQVVHHSLFPKNLLHLTGQFYTPQWLAELLIDDVNWTPAERLVDPFCGSGVFLLCAMERAVRSGMTPTDVLPNLLGIDLNPTACAAARANLAVYLSRHRDVHKTPFHLNIVSADSLGPALAEGLRRSSCGLWAPTLIVDGEEVKPPKHSSTHTIPSIVDRLCEYGLRISNWVDVRCDTSDLPSAGPVSPRDRRVWEQLFVNKVKGADVVVTNPPWVGWEYIPRSYRDTLTSAWTLYDLFKVKGLNAAFLKEDLSTLALMVCWDMYLVEGGRSAVVLRPAAMHSDLAARGLRRLSLVDCARPLRLRHIRTFSGLRVFLGANTDAAAWQITKGSPTLFPVPVTEWSKSADRWKPDIADPLSVVSARVTKKEKSAHRTDPKNAACRWLIADDAASESFASVQGSNTYVPRMGVFTGGANGVFYLRRVERSAPGTLCEYQNIIERVKRPVPASQVFLESALVFSVVRGRDIQMWNYDAEVFLLCPHTRKTKMYPLDEQVVKDTFPYTYRYLCSMRSVLGARQGFAGWEKRILEKYFYTLQRIGEYTFAPYKVCWKYIASEFTVCVIETVAEEKPVLPNDKVMFVPFEAAEAAYFLAGLLSMTVIRSYVNSCASKRQISTSVIRSLGLPQFDEQDALHVGISQACREGHSATRRNDATRLRRIRRDLDGLGRSLYGLRCIAVRDKRLLLHTESM